jgi:hypothetical protein
MPRRSRCRHLHCAPANEFDHDKRSRRNCSTSNPEFKSMSTVWLMIAVLTCLTGLAWLALAMEVHWQQVRGTQFIQRLSTQDGRNAQSAAPAPSNADAEEASDQPELATTNSEKFNSQHPVRTLRILGAMALLISLVACLQADHAGMAALVWIMLLAAGAKAVAMLLTWRPAWLRVLIPWAG